MNSACVCGDDKSMHDPEKGCQVVRPSYFSDASMEYVPPRKCPCPKYLSRT